MRWIEWLEKWFWTKYYTLYYKFKTRWLCQCGCKEPDGHGMVDNKEWAVKAAVKLRLGD